MGFRSGAEGNGGMVGKGECWCLLFVNACNSIISFVRCPLPKVDEWMVVAILINAL